MDMGLLHHAMCLFLSHLLLVLVIAPNHRRMARLSSPGLLVSDYYGISVCADIYLAMLGPGVNYFVGVTNNIIN